jgi:hypothetical protein
MSGNLGLGLKLLILLVCGNTVQNMTMEETRNIVEQMQTEISDDSIEVIKSNIAKIIRDKTWCSKHLLGLEVGPKEIDINNNVYLDEYVNTLVEKLKPKKKVEDKDEL